MRLDESSLSRTVDAVHDAHFHGQTLPAAERTRLARWIASRQGLSGAYADTFAGFEDERVGGIVVFTGERMTSASARHILGEEASRALRVLDVRDIGVREALRRADRGLLEALGRPAADSREANPGVFCCGRCTIGLWRNLLAGGLDRQEERLHRGLGHLESQRKGDGTWQRYPFWYTVLALIDIPAGRAGRLAEAELTYVAPALTRAAARRQATSTYAQRRTEIARRGLDRL